MNSAFSLFPVVTSIIDTNHLVSILIIYLLIIYLTSVKDPNEIKLREFLTVVIFADAYVRKVD